MNTKRTIAEYGTDDIRWRLIDDKNEYVRGTVAKYGTDDMCWELIDDKNEYVREKVAKSGTKKMCKILRHDKNERVRRYAENRLYELEKEERKEESHKVIINLQN